MSLDKSPISLVDLSVAKHAVETLQSLGGARKNHQPRYRPVDTVHHAAEHVSRLIVLPAYIFLYSFRQRNVASPVPLHDFPGPLIDNDYMVVLVDNFHTYVTEKPAGLLSTAGTWHSLSKIGMSHRI